MNAKRQLTLLVAALAALFISSCAGPGEGGYDAPSGPYYGAWGPYGDGVYVGGGGYRRSGHYGEHHIYGHGFTRNETRASFQSGGGGHVQAAAAAHGAAHGGGGHSGGGGGHR